MSKEILANVCPRCGRTGYVKVKNINGRNYYYFVHWNSDGKRKTYCYIGPVEGYYAVNVVYEDKALDLTNVMEVDLAEVAKRAIKNYVDIVLAKPKRERLVRAYNKLQRLHKLIHKALKAIEAELTASSSKGEVGA